MVILNKIYTRTGDGGQTALGDGRRVAKYDLRVCAYGTVDELNATVGLARLYALAVDNLNDRLLRIQNDLFDLGADLCRPISKNETDDSAPLRVNKKQVTTLENEIDEMNVLLTPLRSFILPGGSILSSNLHLCRTVCRRAERLVVELANNEMVNAQGFKYLNRLSDWFFVTARVANNNGSQDVLWLPGGKN